MSENGEIIKNIMNGIIQTGKWERISTNDPQITAAERKLDAVMQKISASVPRNVWNELESAITFSESAYTDAAVLYGMYVAYLIQTEVANPSIYSEYVLHVMGEKEVSA